MTRAAVAVTVFAAVVSGAAGQPPARTSGFDVSTFDRSVRPQDNLYRYVNGAWLDRTPMPDDRVSHTAATELIEKTNEDVRAIVEDLASRPERRPGSAAQQIVDLYASMMDEATIEARGITPLEPELRAIERADSLPALAQAAGRLSSISTAGPFFATVGLDPRYPSDTLVHLAQGGLLLDRDHYLNEGEASRAVRDEYRKYLERIFTLTGRDAPANDAAAVLAIEIELARAHWPGAAGGDPAGPTRPLTLREMATAMPGFDWSAWARPQGVDRAAGIIVVQPTFFRTFAALVPTRPLATWRAWLAARYITAMSPFVNQAVSDARFEFFGRFLTGQAAPIPRWKRAVAIVNSTFGDAVGRLYVERHFPRTSRSRVERIVDEVVRACRQAVSDLDWMSAGTRAEAQRKLSMLVARVGFPDAWRDYQGLEIRPDDLFGNLARARLFDNARRMARVARPDERGQWLATPQTVNAYYVPAQNEIILPAAMLQPPYFDAAADDAVNYGAIGAVIGHEIGHGLDEIGRQYDGTGAVRDWWKAPDATAYRARVDRLLAELNSHPPIDGHRLNGALVLAESAGDLTGLSVAYRAYRRSQGDRAGPVIDGLTGDQRFFLGWARIWRSRERPEYRRQLTLSSRHAPAEYRANGTVGHLAGFHDAFGVGPGDALFIPPARRVHVY